jgi:alpha-2-macroglobulin
MSESRHSFKILSLLVLISVLASAMGCRQVVTSAATPSLPPTNTLVPSATATVTSTPTPQQPVEEAELDSSIAANQFPPDGKLTVRFAEAMEIKSSQEPLVAFPTVEGTSHWNTAGTVLTFQPSAALAVGQAYTFFLDPGLKTVRQTSLPKLFQWKIAVDGGPLVESCSPAAGELSSRQPIVLVNFSRPMDRLRTQAALMIQPAMPFKTMWKDDQTLQINFSDPLKPDTRYDLRLAAGAGENGAADKNGIGLADEYVWSYWLAPLDISLKLSDEKTVELAFSQPMKMDDGNLPFTLQPPLQGSWKWASATVAEFTADAPIPAAQEYTLTIASTLLDEYGVIFPEPQIRTFSGIPPIEINIPVKTDSWGYVLNRALNFSPIPVIFSSPVDHASAEQAFQVSPAIAGHFSWEQGKDGDILNFSPDRLFESGTNYHFSIQPSVRDPQGGKMIVTPVEAAFNTDSYFEYYSYASFGYGADIQIINSKGWRYLQYGGYNNATAHFELYGYGLNDFTRLYANQHGQRKDFTSSALMPIPAEGEKAVASWWQTPKAIPLAGSDNNNVLETSIPADVPAGLYVLNMSVDGMLYDQLFVVLTQNTLMVKRSADELYIWLSGINGKSVPDATIRLYSSRGEIMQEGSTGEDGIYHIPIGTGFTPMLISARVSSQNNADDITVAGVDSDWNTVIPYSETVSTEEDPAKYTAYIYTDRPVYKPGQTVNFKAIFRRDRDMRYSMLPVGSDVTINIHDARGNLVQSTPLQTNAFGSVDGSFSIIDDAMLGDYSVEAVLDGESHTQAFKVQDYNKPDFQLTIDPIDPQQVNDVVVGESIPLRVSANYYFGEPVKNPQVTINKYVFQNYGDWQPTDSIQRSLTPAGDFNGEAVLTVSVPKIDQADTSYYYYEDQQVPVTYAVEVVIDDGSHQPVSSSYVFTVHPSSETISVDNGGYFQRPGQEFSIHVAVKDLAGQPVAGRKLSLQLTQWDRGTYDYVDVDAPYLMQTDAQGRASQELTLKSGWYELDVSGQDSYGHAMDDTSWVGVFSGADDWFSRTQSEVEIISEKDSYKPYDTAHLTIESTFSGPALLTFERGRVIYAMPVQLTAPFTVIDTEVLPDYAPNVFVTVNAWQPSKRPVAGDTPNWEYWGSNIPESYLRLARVELKVDAQANALQVDITTDKSSYAPGETAQATIHVTDAQGKPARAEVSLALVDEAIFALGEETAPDIFSAFYGEQPLSVQTFDSMAPDRLIIPPGGRGSGGSPAPMDLRSNFQDTAAWFPALDTDSSGQVSVAVPLPDNLTSWRLTAKAITLNSQVGQGTANILTKKDLVVMPILPGALVSGDQAELTVLVHNYSAKVKTINVSLQAAGLVIHGEASQAIVVDNDSVKPVTWQISAVRAGDVNVLASASDQDGMSDAVQLSFPVQPAAIASVQDLSGEFNGDLKLKLPMPPVIRESSQVTLQLDRSQAGTILTGLDYLTGYPYGCIEQTMSRALPNAVVSRAAARLNLDPGLHDRVDPLVRASIQRLYSMQHDDGGWGWWFDDPSDDYQTSWVVFGLALMSQAGYQIDPSVIDRAAKYLDDRLDNSSDSDKLDIRTEAFVIYSMALAGKPRPEAARFLMDGSLNQLDSFSQAALALAFSEIGDTQRARTIMDLLDSRAVRDGGKVYWPDGAEDGEYEQKTMASTLRATALILNALVQIDPQNELIQGTLDYLVGQRQGTQGWGTTNETSFAILALTNALVSQIQQTGNLPYEVRLGGTVIRSGDMLSSGASIKVALPIDQLVFGLNDLEVTTAADAHLYYNLTMSYALPQEIVQEAGNVGVTRYYMDAQNNTRLTNVSVGQLVKVVLTITNPQDAPYILVEDHLPGGLEPLSEELNITPRYYSDYESGYDYYEGYCSYFDCPKYEYNYKDIHNDRVDLFFTQLSAGRHTYTYLARATTQGTFLALPAEAYAMYDPKVWGRSASDQVIVQQNSADNVSSIAPVAVPTPVK